MKKVLIISFLSVPYLLVAQDFNTIYYNAKWEVTSMKYAKYYRNSGFDPSTLTFDSIVTDRYIDGSVEMTGCYSKGIKNGQFVYYYPNKSIKLSSYYLNNKRSGTWTSYYENGQIEKVVDYSSDKEKLIEFFDKDGTNILKDHNGKFFNETYYNYYLKAFSQLPLDERSEKFSISGKIDDGHKSGNWTINRFVQRSTRIGDGPWRTSVAPMKVFQLKFQNGILLKGWQYLSGDLRIRFDFDTLTYFIPEPEKIIITESIFNEPGQMIKQNYLIKAVLASKQKATNKVTLESESEIKGFFDLNYSHYAQNCSDTIKLNIGLIINDQGQISVSSISPRIGTGFEKEVYRVINLISKVKIHSHSSFVLNYRIHCVDELDFKK